MRKNAKTAMFLQQWRGDKKVEKYFKKFEKSA
jgi:hypothetical protein